MVLVTCLFYYVLNNVYKRVQVKYRHDDEDDEGDVDVAQRVFPVVEDLLVVQVLGLSSRPGDVTEHVVDRLPVRQLGNEKTT